MTPNTAPRLTVLALAGVFVLAACGDREPDTGEDAGTQAAGAPADAPGAAPGAVPPGPLGGADGTVVAPAPEIRVTGLDFGNRMGEGNRVASPMTVFAPTDTIHASVRTDGDGGGVSARWLFQDGQVVHTEDAKVPAGPQVTAFRVDNPEGWPTGTYTVEFMVDGQVVRTGEFQVRAQ
ncbi:hypothetical protein GCM10028862_20950 [Luteimonas pelagia]